MSKLDNDDIEERVRQYLKKEDKIVVELCSKEDGGGWLAYYEDFPVMGNGDSRGEAIVDAKEAFAYVLRCAIILAGDAFPEPSRS